MMSNKTLLQRLLSKVPITPEEPTACWEWTGYRVNNRYGMIKNEEVKGELTHRVSYRLLCGGIPEGLQILHHCDNPPCIRPSHLFAGTQLDNMKDCVAKGRAGKRGRAKGSKGTSEAERLQFTNKVRELSRTTACPCRYCNW